MTFRIVIINQQGATIRTAASTSGGEIRKVPQGGDPLPVTRLIFAQRQAFDENSIPAFLEAWKKNTVRGDVWCQLADMQTYRNEPVTGYVAFRVTGTQYGVLVGSVEPPIPPVSGVYDDGFKAGLVIGEKAGLDRALQFLAAERAKLP